MPRIARLMIHTSTSMSLFVSLSTLFPYTTLFRSFFIKPQQPAKVPLALQAKSAGMGAEVYSTQLPGFSRSEEHTSELQSHVNLVCRLLLEKKKLIIHTPTAISIIMCLIIVQLIAV